MPNPTHQVDLLRHVHPPQPLSAANIIAILPHFIQIERTTNRILHDQQNVRRVRPIERMWQ
jgi:hypothetical protein